MESLSCVSEGVLEPDGRSFGETACARGCISEALKDVGLDVGAGEGVGEVGCGAEEGAEEVTCGCGRVCSCHRGCGYSDGL
jgi:hypothetical protein